MEIQQGYSYHIKDEFFDLVQDKYLMSNKEQGNYRPHYYAIQDRKNPKLYWMIPISSQAEKYKEIVVLFVEGKSGVFQTDVLQCSGIVGIVIAAIYGAAYL